MEYKFFDVNDMPPEYRSLYESLKSEITNLCNKNLKIVTEAFEAQNIASKSVQELMNMFNSHGPKTLPDEIIFFKEVKPKFYSAWIYWTEVLHIEMHMPIGTKKKIKKYLTGQIDSYNNFFNRHVSFYLYCRAGSTNNDEIFFSRKLTDKNVYQQLNLLDVDKSLATGYDLLLSNIIANDQLLRYIRRKINEPDKANPDKVATLSNLQWTNKKVSLAELIYAFYAAGVFNNAQPDINYLTRELCNLFSIDIPNIYKIFEEIRMRKKNRTSFLDFLKLNLLRKMDEDDEHSL